MRSEISAFFMFLKHAYQHSKWLFALVVCFAAAQALVNFKHGAVVSPLYHYGMYSGVFGVKNNYDVILIEANGYTLKGEDFTMQQWDKIYLPVQYYLTADSTNKATISIRNRLFTALGLYGLAGKNKAFSNRPISPIQFVSWYRQYLEKTIGYRIHSLAVREMRFKPVAHILTPMNSDSAKLLLPIWYSAPNINTR